jgi:hypothetical protein
MSELILPLHIGILVITLICIIWADIYASFWLHGKKRVLDSRIVDRLHTGVSLGLIGMIVTGIVLFWPLREYLTDKSDAFFVKMFFVFALVVNSFVIDKYMRIATTQAFKDVSTRQKIILFVSGGISSLSWIGSIVAAFQLF